MTEQMGRIEFQHRGEVPQEGSYYEAEKMARDVGHVREMSTALSENVSRLEKALDMLAEVISPTLKPSNPEVTDDQDIPNPIRCPLADDLARTNDKLYRLVSHLQGLTDRVDL